MPETEWKIDEKYRTKGGEKVCIIRLENSYIYGQLYTSKELTHCVFWLWDKDGNSLLLNEEKLNLTPELWTGT